MGKNYYDEPAYPRWYSNAYSLARYDFTCTDFNGSVQTINAFNYLYLRKQLWNFYQWLHKRGEGRQPYFGWDPKGEANLHMPYFTSGGWINVENGFRKLCSSTLNERFWSRCEYEYFEAMPDGSTRKVITGKKNGLPFSGFYSVPEDEELGKAWEDIFKWFMDEPYCHMRGTQWKENKAKCTQ